MSAQPRHRNAIVQSAAALFRRYGYSATGLADIIARSGAPKGSLYHYFPGGKAQIGEAAVTSAGELVRRTLATLAAETPDAPALVAEYVRWLVLWMEQSAWRDGCPITTVLLETAAQDEAMRAAGRTAFTGWSDVIAGKLKDDGWSTAEAVERAGFAIAALEGSLIQARVEQSPAPILAAGRMLGLLLQRA
jgi:TetR/AcrR family transcriptional repressor of lmrAB and yxaGH operons